MIKTNRDRYKDKQILRERQIVLSHQVWGWAKSPEETLGGAPFDWQWGQAPR